MEGSWHRGQYQAGVTEHSDGGGRAGGLETALWALQKGNVDVGFLQETKLTQGIHTQNSVGYNVLATDADSWHRGGGGSGGLASGKVMVGGEHGQLWP